MRVRCGVLTVDNSQAPIPRVDPSLHRQNHQSLAYTRQRTHVERAVGVPLAQEFASQVVGFAHASLRRKQLPAPIRQQAGREAASWALVRKRGLHGLVF